ncbi:MAG: hypothetical protein JRH19_12090 [Deltaproteobacteria bacterium]|nr:hypothetical protein [Deltaproteobacteria bacterium]
MRCTIVSHTHWDREWYRTFQSFRARLVDTVDRVLDLVAADPGYFFQLDGQSIVLEDYVEIRPERRPELEAACRAGRIAIGPWYVQPDSLLPSGEAHVRNLLEGRRVAQGFGPCSSIAYTPDSFGHPAQFPQLFAGFGLEPFIYWRGNGDELDTLPSEYRWQSPDGTTLRCCHLARGYFPGWGLGDDVEKAVQRLQTLTEELAEHTRGDSVLLMNGMDHMLPDANIGEIAEALAKHSGWTVRRGLLDDFVAEMPDELPRYSGELVAGRSANLLPGVWSTRMPLKLRNRRCEAALEGWAEPWCALGRDAGTPDERAALDTAWRALLANQAHDSICGCSHDRVHEQMRFRYDSAEELADETTLRALERIAGLGAERQVARKSEGEGAGKGELEIAVFNPSPHPRSDRVRLPLAGFPAFTAAGIDPLLLANSGAQGFEVGGQPARLVAVATDARPRLAPDQPVYDLEFVAEAVPAFGWKRLSLRKTEAAPEQLDEGRRIGWGGAEDRGEAGVENGVEAGVENGVEVEVEAAGTFAVRMGETRVSGLAAFEDLGDRGDSYDFDAVGADAASPPVESLEIRRWRHPGGMQGLRVRRVLRVPAHLDPEREARSAESVELPVTVEARITPGLRRVDLHVEVENTARDHRLRLLFPTGTGIQGFHAASTFDAARRSTAPRDDSRWIHPAPRTFPSQGWICAGGLTLAAPGLPEAEVTAEGSIAITLMRAVGWLSRRDLHSRPGDAGPALATPGAQCLERFEAHMHLFDGGSELAPTAARDAELGLRAVAAGPSPRVPEGHALLRVDPPELLLSALKPAQTGPGSVLRLLNPTDREIEAEIEFGFDLARAETVQLDERPADLPFSWKDRRIRLPLPPHALRSVLYLAARNENAAEEAK